MIDMSEAWKRAKDSLPPVIPTTGEPGDRDREIINRWITEWGKDRRLLTAALAEIDKLQTDVELLKQSVESELRARLHKVHEARKAARAEEDSLATFLDALKARGLGP